ncbi:Serine/threonine-protein kinase-like protein CCR4 [Platanthera guangdongensis]|uniref:Serine/threonine-protein kinase-like protein CCR4 n=1 Tax=Platanthera guangdongensis TaxID=2320717 RepID=A0ABR2MPQ9_9ASPA
MSSHLHHLILHLNILIPLLFCYASFDAASSPLSTIAVSELGNQTLVCAIFPSVDDYPYALKCSAFPSGKSRTYSSHDGVFYSAVATGNGFLCALGSVPTNLSLSSMRWWDIGRGPNVSKRVYEGPSMSALVAGDSHVCGLVGDTGEPCCWRWPELSFPSGLRLSAISVGKDFVCGLSYSGEALCFGGNASGILGNEPKGEFSVIAAGTRHACVVSVSGEMICWGAGSPTEVASEISSLALGNDRTCVIRVNGTVTCFGAVAELPPGYETAQFMAMGARGSAFCGVLTENYSVICWGSDAFRRNSVVFNQVLPGTCSSISSCPCGVVPGSGNSCGHGGGICQSCPKQIPSPTPPPPAPAPRPTAVSISPTIPSRRRRRLLFIILGALGFGIGCLASASFFIIRAWNRGGRVHDLGRVPPEPNAGNPSAEDRVFNLYSNGPGQTVVEYPMETLLSATESFAERHKIGSGGFGSVYRAVLPDGRVVAIKRGKAPPSAAAATPSASNSRSVPRCRKEMESAFMAELALLSRVNHKNLVRLYGFCREGAELILVYEFMTRGTLDAHLRKSGETESPLRSWAGRIRVALDAARGIEYLHVYAVPTIIHRDIKSSNILLDDGWTAKVSDFGLSLLNPKEGEQGGEHNEAEAAAAAGTVGYMDPEYYRLRHLTAKSDVYSFGVMLLELLTGSRAVERSADSGTPVNLVEFAVPRIEMDEVHCVLDVRLPPPTPCEIEAVAFVGYLAADCVSPAGRDRPTMSEVVAGLERALFAAAANAGGGSCSTGPSGDRVQPAD